MGKGGKQHGSSYFDGFIRQKGKDFLLSEKPDNLKKKIPTLIKDIAYGNITLEKYSVFFTEHFVKDIVLPELSRICYMHNLHYEAVKTLLSTSAREQAAFNVLQEDGDLANAYLLAYNAFYQIAASNGNLSYLIPLAVQLKKYRFRL